jgi:DNA-binding XRE family transcriptional regulator
MTKTDDALIIVGNLIGEDEIMRDLIAEATLKMQLGQVIYDKRNKLNLTVETLANLMGVTTEVIIDLEEGCYEGDYLLILSKMARVFQQNVKISFLSSEQKLAS